MSGRLLVAYDNYSVYTQNVVEYLDAFGRHSEWEVRYAHVTLGAELGFRLDEFDAVFHSHSVWLNMDNYIGEDYLAELRSFPGVKIAFLQDEGERTDRYRAAIRDLGFHAVLTCVRPEMLERVYPRALFPHTEFIPVLPAYVPDHLAARGLVERPLRERPVKIGYRATDIGARFGRLAFTKFEIGRRMREICEARGIPHDIELTTPDRIFEKRIYGAAWYDFVASCRTNLGSEGCSNIYDFDGSIEALYDRLSAERGRRVSYEEFAPYTDRLDAEFDMAQVTPRVLEAVALRTALILFPGRYSGLIEPEEHYIELKEDFSNVDAVLARLDDLDGLQAMADRAYQRVVASGEYGYRRFVRLVEDVLLRKSRELGVALRPPRRAGGALDLWADPAALAGRRELPTSAPRHFVFFQYKRLAADSAREIAQLHETHGARIAQLTATYNAEFERLHARYGGEVARLNAALAETRLWRGAKRAMRALRLLAADPLGRAALVEAVGTGPSGRRLLVQAARLVAAKRLRAGGPVLLAPFLSAGQLVLRALPAREPAPLMERPASTAEIAAALGSRQIESLALVIDAAITGRSHLVLRDRYELPDLLAWLSRHPDRLRLLGLAGDAALAAAVPIPASRKPAAAATSAPNAG